MINNVYYKYIDIINVIITILWWICIYFSISFLLFFLYIVLRIYRKTIIVDLDLSSYASIFGALSAIFLILSIIISRNYYYQ